ncbi:MAG: glycine-rich domain-containing protein [Candidatus Taylorbacteria bacterium]
MVFGPLVQVELAFAQYIDNSPTFTPAPEVAPTPLPTPDSSPAPSPSSNPEETPGPVLPGTPDGVPGNQPTPPPGTSPGDKKNQDNENPKKDGGPAKDAPPDPQAELSVETTDVNPITYPANQNKQTLSPEIDKTNGSLNYTYPISLPPGRNNVTPEISLSYNSARQENDSIVGFGWNVGIPFIERLNKTGTENLYTTNNYASSLSGELSLVTGSTWAPRSEDSDFLNYDYSGNVWTVKDKNGTTYVFGQTAQSRQDDPSDASHVFKWMLESVTDTNGNTVTYNYFKDIGQIYPGTIDYTSNGGTAGVFKVEFEREAQPFPTKIASPAFVVETKYRIKTITAKINSDWVKKYALTYTTTAENNRSLLATVIESGKADGGAIITLPATSFSYTTNNGSSSWASDPAWHNGPIFSEYSSGRSYASINTKFGDVNGDGFPDAVTPTTFFLNTGKSWNTNTSGPLIPVPFVNPYTDETQKDYGVRLQDVNGDGLADILFGHYRGAAPKTTYSQTFLNVDGTAWTQNTSYDGNTPMFNGGSRYDFGNHQFDDINGDGLLDVVCATSVGTCSGTQYRNNGSGWTITNNFPFSFDYKTSSGEQHETGVRLADLNGDQLADVISGPSTQTNSNLFYMNNGKDWINDPTYSTAPLLASFYPNVFQFGDVNGDGLTDIVCSNTGGNSSDKECENLSQTQSLRMNQLLYINNGYGFTSKDASSLGLPSFVTRDNKSGARINIAYLMDMNGDGLSDIVLGFRADDGTESSEVSINQGIKSQLLKTIIASTGSQSNITYKPSTGYRDDYDNLLNPKLSQIVYTVSSIKTDPGQSNEQSLTNTYANGYYYYNNAFDRKFAGFELVTSSDAAGNVTKTYYHQGNTTNASLGEYDDHISKAGKIYRIEEYDNARHLFRLTVNKWDRNNFGENHDFVKLSRQTVLTYDGNSSHKDTAVEYTYDNANGNLLTKTEWGQVTASADGTFTDTGSDKRVTTYTYSINGATKVNVLSSEKVTDASSARVGESKYYYDTLPLGSVDKGNQTKVEQWKSGDSFVNSQKTYNNLGLVTTSIDPRGKVTSYTYDTYSLYPASVTTPLNLTVQYNYDYSLGKPRQINDENGNTYETVYDGLDRVIEQKIPNFSIPYFPVTKTTYAYSDIPGELRIVQKDYPDSITEVLTFQFFDGLGRLVQESKEAEASGSYNVKDTVYNNVGLVVKQSLPYVGGGSKSSPTGIASLYSTNTYDALGRPLSIVDATGATKYSYDDWKTKVTDKNGKVKNYYKDAYGNLIKVEEINGGSTYATYYEWNLSGKLLKITDALSNIRNFTYDGLGRLLTAQDLHVSGDSTFGTWTNSYDDAGNVLQSVSPNSQTTNYTYDSMSHPLTEDYTGGPGTEITYFFGGCANGKGRLCSAIMTAGANTDYTYDSNGNIASEAKNIAGTTYTTSYTYNRLGNLLTITYPDNAQTKYTYNSAGQLDKIMRKENGGGFTNVVYNFDYNPLGQIATQVDANGATTKNTYDVANLYRLINKKTSVGYVPTANNVPSITLTGSSAINLLIGDTFTEPGYSATDVEDGNLTSSVKVTGSVKTSVAGTYKLNYNVSDSGGMPATEKIRTVTVGTAPAPKFVKVLIIGGGGGGGKGPELQGGGGGAGGYIENNAVGVLLGTYSIMVGAGGVGAVGSYNVGAKGENGNDSSAFDITAIGGGGGAGARNNSYDGGIGNNGGSGGGGFSGRAGVSGAGGTGVVGQGNSGGAGEGNSTYDNRQGGGGGGMGASGGNGTSRKGGVGGVGRESSISGSPVMRGGGGGGAASSPGAGGDGGGGNASNFSGAGDGAPNTGGGGGGGGWHLNNDNGGSGGSGIVIISYPTGSVDAIGGMITTSGGNTIHTFTSLTKDKTFTVLSGVATAGLKSDSAPDVGKSSGGNGSPGIIDLQNFTYTYDPVGNITKIVDASNTQGAKTANYTYDDLYRLTSATISGTPAGQSSYTYSYSYDALGNILTGPGGVYLYQGNSGALKANPHAVTSINNVIYTYDSNGNLIGNGTLTNTWNYKNQITQTVVGANSVKNPSDSYDKNGNAVTKGTVTSSGIDTNKMSLKAVEGGTATNYLYYLYDHEGNRVKYAKGSTATFYPNNFYNVEGTKKTKQIYAGDQLVATVETVGSVVTPFYVHTDHLNSTTVVSDSLGAPVETLDYYPFGAQRISSGSHTEQRQYIGQMYDKDTDLDYLNARYYYSKIGRFLSEDPVFWVGFEKILNDPQSLNSYSYGRNNPILGSDPSGLLTIVIPGTRYNTNEWSTNGSLAGFLSEVQNTFNDTMIVENNKSVWSGGDNDAARQSAADAIAKQINEYHFADGEKLNIVGHSHGGNVANLITGEINHSVDNLVTLGTPVINGYSADRDNVKNQVNAYSVLDPIQKLGGNQLSATGVAGFAGGGAIGGPIGAGIGGVAGSLLGWGQFGYGGRKVNGATNINVTFQALNPFNAHGKYMTKSVWSKVDKKINK